MIECHDSCKKKGSTKWNLVIFGDSMPKKRCKICKHQSFRSKAISKYFPGDLRQGILFITLKYFTGSRKQV